MSAVMQRVAPIGGYAPDHVLDGATPYFDAPDFDFSGHADSASVQTSERSRPAARFTAPAVDGSSRGIFSRPSTSDGTAERAMTDRELYHRLQNLAENPRSVPIARRRILAELSQVLGDSALGQDVSSGSLVFPSAKSSILGLPDHFDPDEFSSWLLSQHNATTERFAQYCDRRKKANEKARTEGTGFKDAKVAGLEMFPLGKEQAREWLLRFSVVKYVDGSWLAHLGRVTGTVSAMPVQPDEKPPTQQEQEAWAQEWRRAARSSWQVMSEELGDGDLERSHVGAYERLMDQLASAAGEVAPPKGEDRAFTEWLGAGTPPSPDNPSPDTEGNDRCWRAAVVQLALSVSPNELLPESLGFNASYEGLPYHLLVSARELTELGFDAYYFWLHISIDNADTGHSAMAREAVISFLEAARAARGDEFCDEMWRRVKAGFALADGVPTTPLVSRDEKDTTPEQLKSTALSYEDFDLSAGDSPVPAAPAVPAAKSEKSGNSTQEDPKAALLKILSAKVETAHGLHSSVHARLAGKSLSEWLEPQHFETRGPQLLDALANSPLWIKRGKPTESKFVTEFEWGGKMFGAFSSGEVKVLRRWVESLAPANDEEAERSASEKEQESRGAYKAHADADVDADAGALYERYMRGPRKFAFKALLPARLLRPIPLPEGLAASTPPSNWSSFSPAAAELFNAILSRPDAIRPTPPKVDALLDALASGSQGKPTEAVILSGLKGYIPAALPSELSPAQVNALMPVWHVSTSPLEHIVSASCGRLATPLGMACVKALRILYGYTEMSEPSKQELYESHDGREVGCMGTEDMHLEGDGVREMGTAIAEKLQSELGGSQGAPRAVDTAAAADLEPTMSPTTELAGASQQLKLDETNVQRGTEVPTVDSGDNAAVPAPLIGLNAFETRPAQQLALPALLLLLSSDPWRHMPTLLGFATSLAVHLHAHPALHAALPSTRASHLSELTERSALWIERAIAIGAELERVGKWPRGVARPSSGRSWHADVTRGFSIAAAGLAEAVRT